MKKTFDDLRAIRARMKDLMEIRDQSGKNIRVVVGAGSDGAKALLDAILAELDRRDIHHVTLSQSDAMDPALAGVVVEVYAPGGEKTTYTGMTPEKVPAMLDAHITEGGETK